MNPRKTVKQADEVKRQLLSYCGDAVMASCPKNILFEAADTIGSLQFDLVEYKNVLQTVIAERDGYYNRLYALTTP